MFKIKRSRNGQYYFKLVGKNGETVLTSETYTRRYSCIRAIDALKKFVARAYVQDAHKA